VLVKGQEVFDPDAYRETTRYFALEDLVRPPDLLILVLGIKTASNKEMANVFAESIQDRMHHDKPTWIVDSPEKPLNGAHLCWSDELEEILAGWPTLTLRSLVKRHQSTGVPSGVKDVTRGPSRKSTSTSSGRGKTTSFLDMLDENEKEQKQKQYKKRGGKKR